MPPWCYVASLVRKPQVNTKGNQCNDSDRVRSQSHRQKPNPHPSKSVVGGMPAWGLPFPNFGGQLSVNEGPLIWVRLVPAWSPQSVVVCYVICVSVLQQQPTGLRRFFYTHKDEVQGKDWCHAVIPLLAPTMSPRWGLRHLCFGTAWGLCLL